MKASASLNISRLKQLLGKATRAPWRLDTGAMGNSLHITASEREGFARDGDGPICHVSTERHHYHHDRDHYGNAKGESRSWKTPIEKARADAELIVEAVNALPELIRRAGMDIAEAAWLIEWPADKYGPVRYWAAGEPLPVISAEDATRFARAADAEAVIRAEKLSGAKPAEHLWEAPKPKKAKAA